MRTVFSESGPGGGQRIRRHGEGKGKVPVKTKGQTVSTGTRNAVFTPDKGGGGAVLTFSKCRFFVFLTHHMRVMTVRNVISQIHPSQTGQPLCYK